MSMLITSGLAKTYGMNETAVKALKPTDLEIKEGEFVAIVGPSGSGKSTLLHLLAGLDKPSAGKVFINEQDIYELSENELSRYRRQNVGFIFQAFNLIPILSAEENIKLPVLMDGKKVDEGYIDEIMDVLDIKERRKHLPGELSGGQQQRVSIARALINNPDIIIADEPTGALDSHTSKEIMGMFKELNDEGITIILITHDINVARQANRVMSIFDGELKEGEF